MSIIFSPGNIIFDVTITSVAARRKVSRVHLVLRRSFLYVIHTLHLASTNRAIYLTAIIHLSGFLHGFPVPGVLLFCFLALLSYWLFSLLRLWPGEMSCV